ncbi:hypothetical protein OS493_021896 [Desmophyllum pertusum]|uniref:EGF-like domain-containing protein n=1 Tax=Desmophyllum pertusum TaxID=174260 RepID=A0A9X0CWY2_9CNID|nr:hypothetical protein OS493_021896 [Desmophyllum pertusum]
MEDAESDVLMARVEWPESRVFDLREVIGYLPCNVKWANAMRFDPSDTEGKCLHFTASSKGNLFVIFSAIPDDKDSWYYVEISPRGVAIFKSQRLVVSTVDVSAVGLGADILYQSYFVCVKETSEHTVIEYGKSQGTTETGNVYLTMIDRENPQSVRFFSYGNGEETLEIVDSHIVPRSQTKANCKGDTSFDVASNMCVQSCHELCDPDRGCRRTSSSEPLATDCNACQYVKNAQTGECLEECPEDWEQRDHECYHHEPTSDLCLKNPCLNDGTCINLGGGKYKCDCHGVYGGNNCEKECEKTEDNQCCRFPLPI